MNRRENKKSLGKNPKLDDGIKIFC